MDTDLAPIYGLRYPRCRICHQPGPAHFRIHVTEEGKWWPEQTSVHVPAIWWGIVPLDGPSPQ